MSRRDVIRKKQVAAFESLESRTLLSIVLPASSLKNLYRPNSSQQATAPSSSIVVTSTATVWQPMTSAELTAAINSANLGDTIILHAGTTYVGNWTLKNKTTGSGFITIESDQLANLPEGVRVSPADAVHMPKLVSAGGNVPVFQTEYPNASGTTIGAHHFKFLGLEMTGPTDNSDLVALMQLGTTDTIQDTLQEMPHDFVIDRCYMHANLAPGSIYSSQNLRRAIALNTGATDITNNYIQEMHDANGDSQAIGGSSGAGPYNILNNFLEAASENILFGGSAVSIPNTVPSDIVIHGNYFYKPVDWMQGTNGATKWAVKNLFEIKAGRRITVDGNVFENNWSSGQDGTAIVIKIDQYSSSRPWQVTEDITFQNNILRHSNNAIAIQGRDWEGDSTTTSPYGLVRRITIKNNIWDDINKTPWGTWNDPNNIGGNYLYLTQGPLNVTFDHNTVLNGRTIVNVDSSQYPTTGFVFTNNIVAHNTYGVFGTDASGIGDPVFDMYFSDSAARFNKNVIMDSQAKSSNYTKSRPNTSPYFSEHQGHQFLAHRVVRCRICRSSQRQLSPDQQQSLSQRRQRRNGRRGRYRRREYCDIRRDRRRVVRADRNRHHALRGQSQQCLNRELECRFFQLGHRCGCQ